MRPSPKKVAETLLVFARHPFPGQVKTRLIPALGEEGAAELYRNMAVRTVTACRRVRLMRGTTLRVCFAGDSVDAMAHWLGRDIAFEPQTSGDLGVRMKTAFAKAFHEGAGAVLLVGTDCPDLDASVLNEGFEALHHHDLVLGPASDGGYYLIGMKQSHASLFDGIAWSTNTVLESTLERASLERLDVVCLDVLHDVDTADDLIHWLRRQDKAPPRVSVIIPALNEASRLPDTLVTASRESGAELIVACGQSTDETATLAETYGARVVRSPNGRGIQMNAGAELALSSRLLFLHADCRLPSGYVERVVKALDDEDVALGAFPLKIDRRSFSLAIIAWFANFRARFLGLPYGDQALFMKAERFHHVGGFTDWPIMEDVDLVHRLRRAGRVAIQPDAVVASARRWTATGPWRLSLLHLTLLAGYYLGMSADRLARWRARFSPRE